MHAAVEVTGRSSRSRTVTQPAGLVAETPSPAPAAAVDVCGVRIDAVTAEGAASRMAAAALAFEPLQVCTVNLQFLVSAVRDRRVRRILRTSGLNVADGKPVLWLARLRGARLPERVAGADLVPLLMDAACREGLSVFLLGGQDGVAARAAAALRLRHPGLRIAGTLEPAVASLDAMDSDAILESVRASGADIVLVAFGHPRQELWIAANRNRLAAPVAVGVGCTLDLLAGRHRRAPRWMGGAGLEWLFRLAHEPRRLGRRYATQAVWLTTVLAPQAASQRRPAGGRRTGAPGLAAAAAAAAILLAAGACTGTSR